MEWIISFTYCFHRVSKSTTLVILRIQKSGWNFIIPNLIKFGVNESMILTLFLSSNTRSIHESIMLLIALLE